MKMDTSILDGVTVTARFICIRKLSETLHKHQLNERRVQTEDSPVYISHTEHK